MKYNAFLSYSHAADNALAPALQSALHRFARPWNRMRALRVFRDKTSLAASPELWAAIVAALSDAEYFLLLASPAAAASRWVQREIEWWLENRPPQKMLILLTDGELAWNEASSDFEWERTNALPPSLRGRFATEPLWVDLRWAKSGETLDLRHGAFRLAVLDIAAPLHGRSKDELDGEDVRQFSRTRRLAATAIAALVVLTISSVAAAIFAVRQRDEALRQSTTAQAGRLAAQADLLRERGGLADESVVLAAEGLRLLDSIGTRSLEVDLSLRRALALLPRTLGAFEVGTNDEVEIAPDGRHLTLRGVAQQVSVRRLPGGEPVGCRRDELSRELAAHGQSNSILIQATSASGSHCATVGEGPADQKVIDIWSAAPLSRIASVPYAVTGHLRLALSHDAGFLAITDRAQSGKADAGTFRLWSRVRQADVLQQTGAEFIAFGPDGKLFAASNGVWRLPDAGHGEAIRVLAWPREAGAIVFSRDGRRIATRSDYEGEVEVWDLGTARAAPSTRPPAGQLLALSDDGRFLMLYGGDGTVLWDIERGTARARVPIEGLSAAFGEREAIVVATDPDNTQTRRLLVLAVQPAGAALAALDSRPSERVRWMSFSGQDIVRLVDAGTTMRIDSWRWASAEAGMRLIAETPGPASWAISADGRRFAIGRADGIAVGAIDGSGTTRQFAITQVPRVLALSARGDLLAAATRDTVQVWKLDSGERWTSPPVRGDISALRVSDDGRYSTAIVAAGEATRAGVPYQLLRWRLDDVSEPAIVALGRHLHPPDLRCLVNGDGTSILVEGQRLDIAAAAAAAPPRIIGSGETCEAPIAGAALRATIDGEHVVVTDKERGRPIARLEHPAKVQLAALSADAHHAATLDEGGSVRVWALDPAGLIAQACAQGPRTLSAEAWNRYMPAPAASDACGRGRESEAITR